MAPRKKTSPLWNHFVGDDSEKKGKCNYCPAKISFTAGSLGNLLRHLKRKHPTICTAPEEQQVANDANNVNSEPVHLLTVAKQEQNNYDPLFVSVNLNSEPSSPTCALQKLSIPPKTDGKTQKPLPPCKKSKIDQQLITMIAKEYHPLNIVNDTEFKKFIELLNPSYSLPTKETLSESLLPQRYMQLKQQVQTEISKAVAVCITADSWASDNGENLIAITAHYIDPEEGQLCENLLGCINYNESHTTVDLCQFLKDELNQWQIAHKVEVIVTNDTAIIPAAVQLGGWRTVGCFGHTLNFIVQAGIETISDTVNRVKLIVQYFQTSTTGLDKLKSVQKQMNMRELKLKQDVSTLWNTTYDMLDCVVKIKDSLIPTLVEVRPDLALTPEDWTIIEMALPILKIFYEVTVELSNEKSVCLSKVIVYCQLIMRKIRHSLLQAEAAQDSSKICTMLQTLNDQLHLHFNSIENNTFLAECTILDPRFKGKGFRDGNNYKNALATLKNKLEAMWIYTPEPIPCKTEPIPTPSSSKVPSLWNDFDEEVASLVPENSIAPGIIELDTYIHEPIIHRSEDALLWWHTRKSVFPLLYKYYVLKRLNNVATSVPCDRIFSKAGLTMTNRRKQLKAKTVSMLLFIASNQK